MIDEEGRLAKLQGDITTIEASIQNEMFIFPEDTHRRCLFTAGSSQILRGVITGGPFADDVNEPVLGSVSGATGVITYQGEDWIEVDSIVGVFDPADVVSGAISHATIGTPIVICDQWSAWTEIVDDQGVKLSSVSTLAPIFLDELAVSDYSVPSKRYILEISWGAAKKTVARQRIVSADWDIYPMPFFLLLRSAQIPAGELIYYRMKCETVLATLVVNFRYYYVNPSPSLLD